MKTILKSVFVAALAIFTSCETLDLEQQDSPNDITQESASPNGVLNSIQMDFNTITAGVNAPLMGVMRMDNQFGTYGNTVTNTTLDTEWQVLYRMGNSVKTMDAFAGSRNDVDLHLGIAKILQAYSFVTMVDLVGDVPYTESGQPVAFPNPNLDTAESVYAAMYTQLDDAIAVLENETGSLSIQDLYLDGTASAWIKLAKTLKLKMYVTTRLADPAASTTGVNAMIADGDLITTAANDFAFKYQAVGPSPSEARSGLYLDGYTGGAPSTFMSNDFMNTLINTNDPRLRYYIFRQTLTDHPTVVELGCDGFSSYCYLGNGYYGRDHTADTGIPNDGPKRATYGVYPAGGAFDDDLGNTGGTINTGLGGQGILPIMMSSYVDFLQAEAALMLGTTGDAKTLMLSGIQKSMDKVKAFGGGFTESVALGNDATAVTNYMTLIGNAYDAAADDTERLGVIMNEYYKASFGYSLESYNSYRRTGFPTVEDPILTSTGFPRSFRMSNAEVVANPNISDNSVLDQVFWDTNAPGFIQ